VDRQVALVAASPIVQALLGAIDATLLVLNAQRQLVAWNGPRTAERPFGLRPGELLGCLNARAAGGCGAAPACERCGALGAILGCERTARPTSAECVVPTAAGPAVELDVRAVPIALEGELFTIVTLRDVSAERRRQALEQVFFHDLLNTASGLRGWAWHLGRPDADVRKAGARIDALSRQLEREIQDHRALVLAEEGALAPFAAAVGADELLEELRATFGHHPSARERTLELASTPAGLSVETDRALLLRVLVNMVRNALEATPPGGTVRVRCERDERDGVRFSVQNVGAMPPDVQARVFQRSFSTKGRGRGLGTYGMKLIGERYLGGAVSFVSTVEHGTTFEVRVPARLPVAAPKRPPPTGAAA
jgi:signal transduction histidine kinase